MQKIENYTSHVNSKAFIDYRPAELCIKTQWLVVFYAKHPITLILERFRITVPVQKSKSERLKQGKRIVLEVNKKLENGWSPYYTNTQSSEFKTLEYCSTKFLDSSKKDVAKNIKRSDTLKSYTSGISMLNKYILEKKLDTKLIIEINRSFIHNYLDWIFYDRNSAAITHNNHLIFLGIFLNYCHQRGYVKENYAVGILKKKKDPKTREVLPKVVREKLKDWSLKNENYYTLCMATYFCFIRETELTKIKVCDVNLEENYILIQGSDAKNKKTQSITIHENYKEMLSDHLKFAKKTDFVFSDNNFSAGANQLKPKKIYDTWVKFKKEKSVSAEFQFYSLKDSGITDLMDAGIASIKVRDQARHYDIKITEMYMNRNKSCDDVVRNSNISF